MTQSQLNYAGFWIRLAAKLIDLLVMSPIIVIYLIGGQYRSYFAVSLLPQLAFAFWFHVYLVQRYGGTPGKLLMGLKVRKLDGSPVAFKEASLRYSVDLAFSFLVGLGTAVAALQISDSTWADLNFMGRIRYINEGTPTWASATNILMNVWSFSAVFFIVFSRTKRAAHDLIAGTVVLVEPNNTTAKASQPST